MADNYIERQQEQYEARKANFETGTEIWEKENDYQQSSQNGGSR